MVFVNLRFTKVIKIEINYYYIIIKLSMSMITNILPYELTLNILTMFSDIRDIIALSKTNDDINKIITENLDYVIKNIIKNNKLSYPQMSKLISSCYNKQDNYESNMYNIKNLCEFISNVSKEIITNEFNQLIKLINEEEEENGIDTDDYIPLSKTHDEIYKMYHHCRINKKFEHADAWFASLRLTWQDFIKTNFYSEMGYKPSDAIYASLFNDEEVIKMNMLIKKKKLHISIAINCVVFNFYR
jgi:hypothetical protein